jgi:nucleoside 2-deoxyribosyltransferase
MKKTYLAGRFPRRAELEGYVPEFKRVGFDVIARWVFGGEEGLTREDIALLDLEDVQKSDAIVLFTEPYQSLQSGGGRFVEFGYAIALDKELHVIGELENVFTHHPKVRQYATLGDFIMSHEAIESEEYKGCCK